MAFIEIKNLSIGELVKDLLPMIKAGLASIWNIPKWLKAALTIVMIAGICYFGYERYFSADRQSIQELEFQLEQINQLMEENLSVNKYKEDLIYIITEIKLLQQEEDQGYKDELLEIELFIKFIQKYHPNDPFISDLQSMKSRLEVNHDTYRQHYDHVMRQLDKVVNDSVK